MFFLFLLQAYMVAWTEENGEENTKIDAFAQNFDSIESISTNLKFAYQDLHGYFSLCSTHNSPSCNLPMLTLESSMIDIDQHMRELHNSMIKLEKQYEQ